MSIERTFGLAQVMAWTLVSQEVTRRQPGPPCPGVLFQRMADAAGAFGQTESEHRGGQGPASISPRLKGPKPAWDLRNYSA